MIIRLTARFRRTCTSWKNRRMDSILNIEVNELCIFILQDTLVELMINILNMIDELLNLSNIIKFADYNNIALS